MSARSIAQARLAKAHITLADATVRAPLRAATGNKKLQSAADMVFGQYKQLLNDESRWQQMGWSEVDCMTFIEYLDAARVVRNRVMHFGEELRQEDKDKLVHCLNFMRALDPLP
jgi:hypothetical protein